MSVVTRVLVVGLGSIGRRHARTIRELLPDVELGALRRSGQENSQECPEVDRYFHRMQDALDFSPHLAVVCSPANMHVEDTTHLVAARIPALVEKPLSVDATRVDDLMALAHRNGVSVMVGYNLRFSPSMRHFRSMLESGVVGEMLAIRVETGQFLPDWRPGADYRNSVSARSALGGGVLLELSHEIDYLRWLFGEVQWVSALLSRQSRLEIDVEDTAHLMLGWSRPGSELIADVHLDFIRRDKKRVCTVIGSKGTLMWDGIARTVSMFQPEDGWQPVFVDKAATDVSYMEEWRSFLQAAGARGESAVTLADGLATLRIVQAARESSQRGSRVALESD
jgi:predicted dehydrogenase